MGVYTHSDEYVSPVPPARLFKALLLAPNNLIPKIMPLAIKSMEITGDGGPGSFKRVVYAEGRQVRSVRSRIDEVDEEKWWYKYTVVEDDALEDQLENNTTYEAKFEATPEGGCKYKILVTFYTKGDNDLAGEYVETLEEKAMAVYKVVEGYLLQNPDAFA